MRMKLVLAAAALLGSMTVSLAQQEILLYPAGKVPYNRPDAAKRFPKSNVDAAGHERQIATPSLTYYAPEGKANGGAVMILPGGGYYFVSTKGEGADFARYFNKLGYAAFVLHYRLPDSALVENRNRRWVPLADAIQGMRTIKDNAIGLAIDTTRIGVIGFSAGGHLAGTLATIPDKHPFGDKADRPAWTALIYPVASMYSGHEPSRQNLLGGNGKIQASMDTLFSPCLNVVSGTPPAFILHCADDATVPVSNATRYAEAMWKAGNKADLHIYAEGDHGFGNASAKNGPVAHWTQELEAWLKGR